MYEYNSYHYNDRDIVRYCFGRLIQDELNQFTKEWNSHRIRPCKKADAPAGVPDVLYFLPSLNGKIKIHNIIKQYYLITSLK